MKNTKPIAQAWLGGAKLLKAVVFSGSLLFLTQGQAQVTYSFVTCGATGSLGPTQAMATNIYQPTNLNGQVTISGQGIQQWVVPTSGNYKIEAWGAAGGTQFYSPGFPGGKGAYLSGEFVLTAGTVLNIIVGQKGGDTQGVPVDNAAPGGGGGSFVYQSASSPFPLVAAGGGGGGGRDPGQLDANATNNGNAALVGGAGGTGGNGGQVNTTGTSYWAGGGAGWLTDGTGGNNASQYAYLPGTTGALGGRAPMNGGMGGSRYNDGTDEGGDGGFGGGGGGGSDNMGTGGGGGFSGGGGAASGASGNPTGGGGGSYNGGTNQVNTAAVNTGDGKVWITRLCDVNMTATKNPMCYGDNITLSTNAISVTSWNPGGGTSSSIVVSPTVSTSYSVTGVGSNNCVATAVVIVTVVGLPNISGMVVPSILCAGSTASIIGQGGASYTWTSGPGPFTTVSPNSSTVYNFSGSNVFGCVNTASVMVNVNSNSLTVTSNTTICTGKPAHINASGASTYTWNNGAMLPGLIVSPIVNTTYIVNATDANNCQLSGMVAVNVSPLPNVTASASKEEVCPFEPVTLTANGADTYTWSNSQTGASIPLGLPANVVYSYTVTGTSSNGCTQSAVVTVTVSKCVGIEEQEAQSAAVRAYPNPTSGELLISTGTSDAKHISVMDVTGKVVLEVTGSEEIISLDLKEQAAGMYYVRVRSEQFSDVIKVIRQ